MFDLLMSEYNMSIFDVRKLTREQMFLFKEKIDDRKYDELKFNARLHGNDLKSQGLDVSGAVPIEEIIDRGKGDF